MYEHALLLEESLHALGLRERRGYPEDRVPAALGFEEGGRTAGRKMPPERLEVGGHALRDRPLQVGAPLEQRRKRPLDGGGDGKEGVRHDLEAGEGVPAQPLRACRRDPGQLELGKAAALGEATEGEGERGAVPRHATRALRVRAERIVREHLVGHESEIPLGAEHLQGLELVALQEGTRRVVGAHDHDHPGPRGRLLAEGGEVDVPLAVVLDGIRHGTDALQPGEVLEQRIAGAGDEHLVPRIAQELEEERVGFAGARGQQDARGVDGRAAPREVFGHGGAGCGPAEGHGLVAEPSRFGEGQKQVFRVVEAHVRRVRLREVEHGLPPRALALPDRVQTIRAEIPARARRKHGGMLMQRAFLDSSGEGALAFGRCASGGSTASISVSPLSS